MRLPFFIAAFALTLAIGAFALAGRGGSVVAQEPDPCVTEEPTEEPTTEPTMEPTVEPTTEPTMEPTVEPTTELTVEPTAEGAISGATAPQEDTATDESAVALQEPSDGESEDAEALQEECDDDTQSAAQSGDPDPRNFPVVGGRVDPLPPAAPLETSSPARAEADAARAAAAAAAQQPAALPATGMGPDESASSFSWGTAAAVVLLGLGGLTALMARRREL